jgi:hypothetical protein
VCGVQSVHRIGDGIATHLDLYDQFVAVDEEEYVSKALHLAQDTASCRRAVEKEGGSLEQCDGDGDGDGASRGVCRVRSLLCRNKERLRASASGLFPEEEKVEEEGQESSTSTTAAATTAAGSAVTSVGSNNRRRSAVTKEWERFLTTLLLAEKVAEEQKKEASS